LPTPIVRCILQGDLEAIRTFVDRQGHSLEERDADGKNLLEIALQANQLEIAFYFYRRGIQELSVDGWMKLLQYVLQHYSALELKMHDITFPHEMLTLALLKAFVSNNLVSMQTALELGANVHEGNLMHAALEDKNWEAALLLLRFSGERSESIALIEYAISSADCVELKARGVRFDKGLLNALLEKYCRKGQHERIFPLTAIGADALTECLALANTEEMQLQLMKAGADCSTLHTELAKRVEARFKKLCEACLIKRRLDPTTIHQIAYFVEAELPETPFKNYYYLYTKQKNLYYLLNEKSEFQFSGTSKCVMEAIQIPLNGQNVTAVEPFAVLLTQEHLNEEEIEKTRFEGELTQKLQHHEGIWPILELDEFVERDIHRIAWITKRATGDFDLVAPQLDSDQLLQAAILIAKGLSGMHEEGYLHGDFNGKNALVKILPDGSIDASVIDLAFSFRPGIDPINHILSKGYYGSIYNTAPEIFGNRHEMPRKTYFQAEVWAFADTLYRQHFNKIPLWDALCSEYIVQGKYLPIPQEAKDRFRKIVQQEVEEPRALLLQKGENLTKDERLSLVIYQMLRLDPEKRYTLAQAISQLTLLQR